MGAILAQYIEKSGAAQSIAQKVLSITGTEKPFSVLVAIFIISAILTFGGISLFVVLFVVIPFDRIDVDVLFAPLRVMEGFVESMLIV